MKNCYLQLKRIFQIRYKIISNILNSQRNWTVQKSCDFLFAGRKQHDPSFFLKE